MNKVTITGRIKSFVESYVMLDELYVMYNIVTRRLSGTEDEIPVFISTKLRKMSPEDIGKKLTIIGEFRSRNAQGHLSLYVFATELYFHELFKDSNLVELEGYIGKEPTFRTTPLGRNITDILLAVNRKCGKVDYIPCVAWGRNAIYANDILIGSKISIKGRIQSRDYVKDNSLKRAYEVSINQLSLCEIGVVESS